MINIYVLSRPVIALFVTFVIMLLIIIYMIVVGYPVRIIIRSVWLMVYYHELVLRTHVIIMPWSENVIRVMSVYIS